MRDWHAWHEHYDDPDSSLSRRLAVVQRRLGEIVSGDAGVRQILSLCAGDGRDVIPVLADQPPEQRPAAVLVDIDAVLAAAARRRSADAGVAVTVLVGDAGLVRTWREVPPVDLLMLCGIFGNISDEDIRTTIECAPAMLRPGGFVIWTRGWFADRDDVRPRVRRWFADAGFTEVAFDSEPTGYGVGVNRVTPAVTVGSLPRRLFSFMR